MAEELLQELVDAATHLSAADFKDDSPNLKQLVRLVVKLKLLFPPMRTNDRRDSVLVKKMKQPMFTKTAQNVAEIVEDMKGLGVDIRAYDCASIAEKAGNAKASNVALIGLAADVLGFDIDVLRGAVAACVPAKALDVNLAAFDLAVEMAKNA